MGWAFFNRNKFLYLLILIVATVLSSEKAVDSFYYCPPDFVGNVCNPENRTTYIACTEGGRPILMPCNDNLCYDQDHDWCDWCDQVPICTGAPPRRTTTESAPWRKCKPGSEFVNPPKCPPVDGEHPVYFPFPNDCTQFYMCGNGIPYCMICPKRTLWDQNLTTCNHESEVVCKSYTMPYPEPPTGEPPVITTTEASTGGPVPPTSDIPEDTTPITTLPPRTTTTPKYSIPHDPCPPASEIDMYGIFVGFPSSCEYFYFCRGDGSYGGNANCAEGLWFSAKEQKCITPWSQGCIIGGSDKEFGIF